MPAFPLADALRLQARADPSRAALTDGAVTLTRAEVDALSDGAAERLLALGATHGSIVAVTGLNSTSLLAVVFAIWKIGAVPLALHRRKGPSELAALLALAAPSVAVGFDSEVLSLLGTHPPAIATLDALCAPGRRPSGNQGITPGPMRVGTSGGSTGPSKLILVDVPAVYNPKRPWHRGMRSNGTHVVTLDVVDGAGFFAATTGLALGCHLILMPAFDPEEMLALVARHRADWLALSAPEMVATAKLSVAVRDRYDLSSVRFVTHYSGRVAPWAKRTWIDWLGPERVVESYGATDSRGSTWIDGEEWLARPGSVGRAQPGCEIAILAEDGRPVADSGLGHVYLRDLTGNRTFRYLGGEKIETLPGGWETVGDMGWMDPDGYLYLADRASDMIPTITGLVAPGPIEGALEQHHAVRSAIVIGLPAAAGRQRIHALIDAPAARLNELALDGWLRHRHPELDGPETWEECEGPLRDNAGKARRRALRAERLGSPTISCC